MKATSPLPYVSHRAVKRVTNPLPVPTQCPHCRASVELVSNARIYGREYGKWPFVYRCMDADCDAYVGLHPHTDIPLGPLANKAEREARKAHKPAFERLYRGRRARFASRSDAYQWLADQLGIPVSQCHWGWFNVDQAERAGAICLRALECGTAMGEALVRAREASV